ncbi:hypothetical protein TruAng_001267 [Truncatella angustata]|nr:hypothetical protein TruAng_001267 [Truncatella angustata]
MPGRFPRDRPLLVRVPGVSTGVVVIRQAWQYGGDHGRGGRGADREEDPDSHETPHAFPALAHLHEAEQAEADDRVSQYGNPAHAQPVAHQTPDGTGDERDDLIDEAEGADNVADVGLDVEQVGDKERDGRVEEDEEGDAEERYAQQVSRGLQRRRGWGERQKTADARHG